MKALKQFVDYYILGKYHCDKCPFCWEVKTSYEYDEWDCGCYIKGELPDGRCRLLPPIRYIIGNIRKKKSNYYFNHEYDGFAERVEKEDKKIDKLKKLIINDVFKYRKDLYIKTYDGKYILLDKKDLLNDAWKIQSDYEDVAHPFVYKNLKTEWKELFVKTIKSFINKFKPYFCK